MTIETISLIAGLLFLTATLWYLMLEMGRAFDELESYDEEKRRQKMIRDFEYAFGVELLPTGSRHCGTHRPGSDYDYYCYIKPALRKAVADWLVERDWIYDSYYYLSEDSSAARHKATNLNFILTETTEFHERWKVATALCYYRKPATRAERVKLFKTILYAEELR